MEIIKPMCPSCGSGNIYITLSHVIVCRRCGKKEQLIIEDEGRDPLVNH